MIQLYNEIIYNPILNLLVWLYNTIPGHDVGIVIILTTLLIRILLSPIMHKSLKGQKAMSELQPKLNDLKETHKDDKEAHAKAMMDLYKEHGVSPFSSCLPLLIQLPILLALYQVLRKALNGNLAGLYHFVHNPGPLNPKFLGAIDLAHPNIIFAIVAGVVQFWQSKIITKWQNGSGTVSKPADPTAKILQAQMTYLFPLISIFIAWKLPAGLPLYWIVTTLFAVAQQYYVNYLGKKKQALSIPSK